MYIRLLRSDELRKIYTEEMTADFPAAELKPLSQIEELAAQGRYISYGLFDGDELRGYACFCPLHADRWLLLDYYAICRPFRAAGYGSRFFDLLQAELRPYPVLVVEVERVDMAKDEQERDTRTRRLRFYLQNGLRQTALQAHLPDQDYHILVREQGEPARDEDVIAAYRDFQLEILGADSAAARELFIG